MHTPLPETIGAADLEKIGKLDCVRDSFEGRDGTSYLGGQEIIACIFSLLRVPKIGRAHV